MANQPEQPAPLGGVNRSLELTDALSELVNNYAMSSSTTDINNAQVAQDAAQVVATAAQAGYGTLTDCP